jgi:hypothetical protein
VFAQDTLRPSSPGAGRHKKRVCGEMWVHRLDIQNQKMTITLCCDHAQVAVEVHDIDFRLSRIQTLLKRHGSACVVFWQKKWHFFPLPPQSAHLCKMCTDNLVCAFTRFVHRLTTVGYCLVVPGFRVYTERQETKWHNDMLVCVPKDLNLHYVYASRQLSSKA